MNLLLLYNGYFVESEKKERASLPVLGSQYFSTSMEILEYLHGVTGVTTMRDRRSTEQQSPTHHEQEDSEKRAEGTSSTNCPKTRETGIGFADPKPARRGGPCTQNN